MTGYLYIENENIGEINFEIVDESMGAITGQLITNNNYLKFKDRIQQDCEEKGISNITDFNYKVLFSDNCKLKAEGGIGITDIKGFNEIYVEVAGIDSRMIDKIKQND
ncbi:hypothetical protein SAMN02927937_02581 [Paenimyroides aquimaris]|uniref:Uncharacterized protein n=1 Tax=Paenimyroides marinum TaxID=1159016 RepID=A0A1H6MI85_9FLAO|nr:hypothetical protein [Paenimyroides aquimaris]SEH99031.1 hypothetical protein SAMN02927937_02581 [Paenimyroides aquimaris]